MIREKTLELIAEFQTIRIDDDLKANNQATHQYFKLLNDVDIDQDYMELIEKQLLDQRLSPEDIVIRNEKANYSLTKRSLERLQPG